MYNEFDDCFYEPEDDELLLRMMEEDDEYSDEDFLLDDLDLELLDRDDPDEFPF